MFIDLISFHKINNYVSIASSIMNLFDMDIIYFFDYIEIRTLINLHNTLYVEHLMFILSVKYCKLEIFLKKANAFKALSLID